MATKTAKKSKAPKTAKPTAEIKAPAKPKRDGWGARLTTGRHTVNQAVIDAGADGATLKDITEQSDALATKLGITPRKAVGSHLQALKLAGYVDNADRVWKATEAGRKQWTSKTTAPAKLA